MPRADARRNYDQLLAVARQAVAEHGTDASLRDVARRAGVGIGTLYRHFPTREALLGAVLRDQFDRLREEADALLTAERPREALGSWLAMFAAGQLGHRGLPASVLTALRDEGSELHSACHAMRAAAGRLLTRAQQAGQVRTDVGSNQLLAFAAGIAWAGERSGGSHTDLLLSVAMDGLAAGPGIVPA